MKGLFNQVELQGKSYSVIVTTRFGNMLCSASGDLVFHTTPILNTPVETVTSREHSFKENSFRKISNKRRKL